MRFLTLALVAGGIAAMVYKLGQQAPSDPQRSDAASGKRLQDLQLDGSDAGLDPAMSGLGEHEDLLSPSSATSGRVSDAQSPGLPDFPRGA
jgi:hypothetical protein